MSGAGTVEFDPRSDEVMQCPFPHYERLRTSDPVHKMPGEWVGRPGETVYAITRHDLVCQVVMDWETYSSKFGSGRSVPGEAIAAQMREILAAGYQRPPTMLTADPPVHTRYRRLVSKAFTPKRVAELAPAITQICQELVEALDADGDVVDIVPTLCSQVPTKTIAVALGVPQSRHDDFKRWADASVLPIGRQLTDDQWLHYATCVVELQQFFAAEFEARREQPSDDLLSALVAARLTPEDGVEGEPLSMPELISIVQQLQVAGSETTASLIADAVVLLADQPEEWARLATDPTRAVPVVEECLRLASPNQGLFRIVTRDVELAGVPVPAGSTLWVLYGAADVDPDAFEDPMQFNPDRPHVAQHLAFGRGPHYCIGAPLARLEATIALHELAKAYSSIEPVDREALRYAPSCILRGLMALPVRLTRR